MQKKWLKNWRLIKNLKWEKEMTELINNLREKILIIGENRCFLLKEK